MAGKGRLENLKPAWKPGESGNPSGRPKNRSISDAYAERKANRFERYAARFAAKEAGMKALGTGWSGGIRWHDFEVANLPSGRPTLILHGEAKARADRMGVVRTALSLTHTAGQAMAMVILESE